MRITGKDRACGPASSCRVDKIDFSHHRDVPRGGRRRRRKRGLYCHRNLYPFPQTLLHPHVYTPYLSLSLSLYLCASMRYPPWNILQQVSDCFVGNPTKAFNLVLFLFSKAFILWLARTGLFYQRVGRPSASRCLEMLPRSSTAFTGLV